MMVNSLDMTLSGFLSGALLSFVFAVLFYKVIKSVRVQKKFDGQITEEFKALPSDARHFLIIVNPVGGQKKGLELIHKYVIPSCLKKGIRVTLKITTHENHPFEIGAALDKSMYYAVIIAGGDGTVGHFQNGLLSQSRAVLEAVPVGVFPAGTSNGIAMSLTGVDYAKATEQLLDGNIHEVDVVEFKTENDENSSESEKSERENHGIDCHSITWGIIADHDILVEKKLRWMGSIRSQIGPLQVIAQAKSYRGVVRFKPVKIRDIVLKKLYSNPEDLVERNDGWKEINDNFYLVMFANMKWGAHDIVMSPNVRCNEGAVDLVMLRGQVSRWQLLRTFLAMADGSHIKRPEVEVYKVSEFEIEPFEDSWMARSGETFPATKMRGIVRKGGARFIY